jgi:hypothetical protein
MLDFLHHLFVPRESNNHRAHFLHAESLLVLVSILLLTNFLTPKVEQRYPHVLGLTANIAISDLVNLTNQKRAEAGLPLLTLNDQLSQAAGAKAQYMFSHNFWAHNAPDGTTPWVFIKNSGYEYVYAGENLARGFSTAPDAVTAWMASPGHRENILSPNYKDIGFAVATGSLTGDETILIVEMFGNKGNTTSAVGSAQIALGQPTVAPTQAFIPTTVLQPTAVPQIQITLLPSPTGIPAVNQKPIQPSPLSFIAGVNNQPLIDRDAWFRMMALMVVGLFIFVFLVDMIVIERKQIVRLVSHNIDHILFLTLLLLLLLFFGSGTIL